MRTLAYIVAFLAALVAAFLFLELGYIGFPDGHRTELDRARETLWPIYIALLAVVAAVCIAFARKPRFLKLVLAIALVVGVGIAAIDGHLAATLENGSGG